MGTNVTKVVYNGLSIDITSPKLAESLANLDTDGNGQIDQNDFKETPENQILDSLADSFEMGGAFKYKAGKKGFKKMLSVYPSLKNFLEKIAQLKGKMVNAPDDFGEMEFDLATWEKEVKPLFREGGPFSPEKLSKITWKVAEAITELSGSPGARDKKWPQKNVRVLTGRDSSFWYYNSCADDNGLRGPIRHFAESYNLFSQFLSDYREVECDGKGCPFFGEEISLRKAHRITIPIEVGVNNFLDIRVAPSVGCFTGDQFLRGEEGTGGTIISFAELARRDSLPSLSSYNECQGVGPKDEIAQRPTQAFVYPNIRTALMHLNLKTSDGETVVLKVTPDHPLLTKKFGGERWMPAGELQDGDILLGPGGAEMSVDRTATRIEEGAFTLYNLSFTDPSLHPTYAVSPDGKHWVWAHNVK